MDTGGLRFRTNKIPNQTRPNLFQIVSQYFDYNFFKWNRSTIIVNLNCKYLHVCNFISVRKWILGEKGYKEFRNRKKNYRSSWLFCSIKNRCAEKKFCYILVVTEPGQNFVTCHYINLQQNFYVVTEFHIIKNSVTT